jgi:hypothetical protein
MNTNGQKVHQLHRWTLHASSTNSITKFLDISTCKWEKLRWRLE